MSAACCVNSRVNSRFVLSQEESGGRYWRIQTWKTALDHAGSGITSETILHAVQGVVERRQSRAELGRGPGPGPAAGAGATTAAAWAGRRRRLLGARGRATAGRRARHVCLTRAGSALFLSVVSFGRLGVADLARGSNSCGSPHVLVRWIVFLSFVIGLLNISDAPSALHGRIPGHYSIPPHPCKGGDLCRRAARLWRPPATPQALEPVGVPRVLTIAAPRGGSAGTLRVPRRPLRRVRPRPPGRRPLGSLHPLSAPLPRRAPSARLRLRARALPRRSRRLARRGRLPQPPGRPLPVTPPSDPLRAGCPHRLCWPRCTRPLWSPRTRPPAFLRPPRFARACPRWRPLPCRPTRPPARARPRPPPACPPPRTLPTGRRVARRSSRGTRSCPCCRTSTPRWGCAPPSLLRRPRAAALGRL